MEACEALLIIFAKYPEVGQVKTRLAQTVGPERACALYRHLVQAVVERTRPDPRDLYSQCVYYTPASCVDAMHAFLKDACGYQGLLAPQADGDLGARMRDAFARSFAAGARRVVIIGTDAPLLTRRRILDALDGLRSVPVVLGPAEDGGYYLIGLSAPAPDLFEGIPWSTAQVYANTMKKIEHLGLPSTSLPLELDVDDMAALRRLRTMLASIPPAERQGLSALSDFLEASSWF